MKVLIFCGGSIDNYQDIKKYLDADYIICADGGARHLRILNINPNLLLGDFDSISQEDLEFFKKQNIKTIAYPAQKDFTDAEIAVNEAISLGAHEIIILGATGGRMDHTLSNVYLLKKILDAGIFGYIVTGKDEIYLINQQITLISEGNNYLSLLAFEKEVVGITTKGLLYQLVDETLYLGSSRGVSNYFNETVAQIFVKKGLLLVIKTID